MEKELRNSRDEKARRLGLDVLVSWSRCPDGWTQTLREGLDSYRMNESILVAEAATFVFPPEKIDYVFSEELIHLMLSHLTICWAFLATHMT
jgi:hypothetical protein